MRAKKRARAPLARWALSAIVGVVVFGATTAFVLARPTGWRAEAVVALGARPGAGMTGDLLQLTADKYVAYMGSPALERQIANSVDRSDPPPRDAMRVSRDTGTANVRIEVSVASAASAAALANAIAQAAVTKADREETVRAEVVAPADAALAEETPEPLPYLVGAFILALFAGALTWYASLGLAARRKAAAEPAATDEEPSLDDRLATVRWEESNR